MAQGGVRIGAVAERLGVPAATLRTWERRYGVTSPERAAGRDRRYSDEDVARLAHIVALREHGERVADLAQLGLEELLARRARYDVVPVEPSAGPLRVAILGDVDGLEDGRTADGRSDIIVAARHAFLLEDLPDVDAVAIELPLLGDDPAATLLKRQWTWSGKAVLVAYRFAPSAWLEALAAEGARTVRLPVSRIDLEGALVDAVLARQEGPRWPKPALGRVQLRALERVEAQLACECPNQLASITLALSEFETYARSCAARSPEDAALHRRLAIGTRRARGVMEGLLRQVCEEEGIEWPTE